MFVKSVLCKESVLERGAGQRSLPLVCCCCGKWRDCCGACTVLYFLGVVLLREVESDGCTMLSFLGVVMLQEMESGV